MIKFREIKIEKDAIDEVVKALAEGKLTVGPYVEVVESLMQCISGCRYAVAVSSGTMALKIALQCMGIGRGDKVVVPDITFVSCANAVKELGGIPVFAEVDPRTFVLTEETVKRAIWQNGGAKAIMAVNLAGVEVKGLEKLGLPVLYDAAHFMGNMFGRTSCFSFHPTKIVSGIEGGCITTEDPAIYERAKRLRNFGFKDSTRELVEPGYKANLTNISAILIAFQLSKIGKTLDDRAAVRDLYNIEFGLRNEGLGMYPVLVDDPDKFMAIGAIRHYPKTLSEMYSNVAYNYTAREISRHLISLPFHEFVTAAEMEKIINAVKPHLITL